MSGEYSLFFARYLKAIKVRWDGSFFTQMFTAEYLSDMKKRALRKGVWYRTLDRVERGIVSLTARIVDRVESKLLGIELVKIMSKLVNAMKGEFVRHMESFGVARARELARQAMEWSCTVAAGWVSDLNFSKYLSMMEMNKSPGYGVQIN